MTALRSGQPELRETSPRDGHGAAVQVRRTVPETALLVLSQHVEVVYADELLAGGTGVGYLLKDRVADVDAFLSALRDVVADGTVLDPQVVAQLFARLLVGAVEKHTQHIFAELGLAPDEDQHRRVLATLAYLRS